MNHLQRLAAVTLTMALTTPIGGAFAQELPTDRSQEREQERAKNMPVERRLDQVKKLLMQNQGPQAAMTLNQIKKDHPDHPEVLAYEGQILVMQNNVSGALTALNAAVAKEEHQPMANALLAFIDLRMGKPDEAQKRLEATMAVHPDHPHLLMIAAQLKMHQADFEAAAVLWEKLAAHQQAEPSQRAQANAQLGLIYGQQNKHAQSAEAMGKALAINWVPDVALEQIRQYHQAQMPGEALEAIRIARQRLHQHTQVLQQLNMQIAPIEQELKLAHADQVIAGKSSMSLDASIRFTDNLRYELREAKDEPTVALRQRLEKYQVDAHLKRLENTLADTNVTDLEKHVAAVRAVIGQVHSAVKRDPDRLDTPEVAKQLAGAQEHLADAYRKQGHVAIKLIDEGWRLQDFDTFNADQKAKVEENGLKTWREMPPEDKEILTTYLSIKQDQRNAAAPKWESQMNLFTSFAGDEEKLVALAKAFAEHVKDIDVSDEEVARQAVLQDFVFSKPHTTGDPIGMGMFAFRERSFTYWDNFAGFRMKESHDWPTLIAGCTEILRLYPRPAALRDRGMAHFFAGDLEKAYHDIAASVAVASWERARLYRFNEGMEGRWDITGVPVVQQLHALVNGQRTTEGPFPTAPLMDALDHIKNERWLELARYAAMEHPQNSFDKQLVDNITFHFIGANLYTTQMLDALVEAIRNTSDAADREALLAVSKKVLGSGTHPYFSLLQADQAENEEQRGNRLRYAILKHPRDVSLNVAYARHLEKTDKTTEAMHCYNVAAGGKNVNQLTGDAKAAAEARDRLEGKGDPKAIQNIYIDFANAMNKKQNRGVDDGAQWEAALLRLETFGVKRAGLIGQIADARAAMKDHAGANLIIDEMLKASPERAGQLNAIKGVRYKDLKQFPQAINSFNVAIESGFQQPWVYAQRGHLHRQMMKFDEAVADYSVYLEVQPEDDNVLNRRSELYEYIQNEWDKALVDAEKVMEIRKKRNPEYDSLAMTLRIGNLKSKIALRKLRELGL